MPIIALLVLLIVLASASYMLSQSAIVAVNTLFTFMWLTFAYINMRGKSKTYCLTTIVYLCTSFAGGGAIAWLSRRNGITLMPLDSVFYIGLLSIPLLCLMLKKRNCYNAVLITACVMAVASALTVNSEWLNPDITSQESLSNAVQRLGYVIHNCMMCVPDDDDGPKRKGTKAKFNLKWWWIPRPDMA